MNDPELQEMVEAEIARRRKILEAGGGEFSGIEIERFDIIQRHLENLIRLSLSNPERAEELWEATKEVSGETGRLPPVEHLRMELTVINRQIASLPEEFVETTGEMRLAAMERAVVAMLARLEEIEEWIARREYGVGQTAFPPRPGEEVSFEFEEEEDGSS